MFDEDLDAFFDDRDFAVAATYDSTTAVKVIKDEAFLAELGVASTNPQVIGKASDFPETSARGKTLAIGVTTYTIKNRRAIDDGKFVVLELND